MQINNKKKLFGKWYKSNDFSCIGFALSNLEEKCVIFLGKRSGEI